MVVDTIGFPRDLHRQLPYAPIPTCCMSWSVQADRRRVRQWRFWSRRGDPGTFTCRRSGIQRFRRVRRGAIEEAICAENNINPLTLRVAPINRRRTRRISRAKTTTARVFRRPVGKSCRIETIGARPAIASRTKRRRSGDGGATIAELQPNPVPAGQTRKVGMTMQPRTGKVPKSTQCSLTWPIISGLLC